MFFRHRKEFTMKYLEKIHIGSFLKKRYEELEVSAERACAFFDCDKEHIEEAFQRESLETDLLLKWSKLLEYDFFRLYSHHILLYAPSSNTETAHRKESQMPQFRKNIYTKEIIDYMMMMVENKEKTPIQIVQDYRIPKTTLYRWIEKFKK